MGLNQSSYLKFCFSHAFLSLLCRASQRSSSPSKKHLERASYSTASVRPQHSGDSPEISQKATMVVTQKPHQCICSVTPAGEPSLLRRCQSQISTPSHGIHSHEATQPQTSRQTTAKQILPITALLGATEMKFIPPQAQGDLEPQHTADLLNKFIIKV